MKHPASTVGQCSRPPRRVLGINGKRCFSGYPLVPEARRAEGSVRASGLPAPAPRAPRALVPLLHCDGSGADPVTSPAKPSDRSGQPGAKHKETFDAGPISQLSGTRHGGEGRDRDPEGLRPLVTTGSGVV